MTPGLLSLPRGYYAVHPDVSLNFQMNRWFSWVGEAGMLEEMRTVAPRIATYADWQREFAALAQQALAKGQNLRAAYYLRAAEFFLLADAACLAALEAGFPRKCRQLWLGIQVITAWLDSQAAKAQQG